MVLALKRLPSLPASCPSAHFLCSRCHARWWRHTEKQAMVSAHSLCSEIHENSAGMSVAVGMYEWLSKTMVNTHYTMFCAAGVVVAVPVTIVFLCLQKYYVAGVTGGAVKG